MDRGPTRSVAPRLFEYRCEFAAIVKVAPQPSRLVDMFMDCLLGAHGVLHG